jgi:hypothetical protein
MPTTKIGSLPGLFLRSPQVVTAAETGKWSEAYSYFFQMGVPSGMRSCTSAFTTQVSSGDSV